MNGTTQRYVLLPREGVTAASGPAFDELIRVPPVTSTGPSAMAQLPTDPVGQMLVIDSTHENGPKLVEADAAAIEALNRRDAPVRAIPVIEYAAPNPPVQPLAATPTGGPPVAVVVECTDAQTGQGVPGATVVAFTDFAAKAGAKATTDGAGRAMLTIASPAIERLYVYPPLAGYWGGYRAGLTAAGPIVVPLTPLDLAHVDAVRGVYGATTFDATAGVQVGVIDTGVGPHHDLNVVSGMNTVTGELPTDYADPRGHGTHVAGLIGAAGTSPTGVRGLAPGANLRAYRVFPAAGSATSYAILKAMIYAADDGCDLINLSLGGGPYDAIVAEAVRDARNRGMLVVVATGNDGRAPVNYPAAYPQATAVSAVGRDGTFPAGSLEEAEVVRPPLGTDPLDFVAGFSNVGTEVAVTAPGVGCISTIFGNRYGVMSGTSMAAPVVTGAAACLLSRDAVVRAMPRDAARSDAIARLLTANCTALGFGALFEGKGMPDPAKI